MTTRHEVFNTPRILPNLDDIENEIKDLEEEG